MYQQGREHRCWCLGCAVGDSLHRFKGQDRKRLPHALQHAVTCFQPPSMSPEPAGQLDQLWPLLARRQLAVTTAAFDSGTN